MLLSNSLLVLVLLVCVICPWWLPWCSDARRRSGWLSSRSRWLCWTASWSWCGCSAAPCWSASAAGSPWWPRFSRALRSACPRRRGSTTGCGAADCAWPTFDVDTARSTARTRWRRSSRTWRSTCWRWTLWSLRTLFVFRGTSVCRPADCSDCRMSGARLLWTLLNQKLKEFKIINTVNVINNLFLGELITN